METIEDKADKTERAASNLPYEWYWQFIIGEVTKTELKKVENATNDLFGNAAGSN